MELYAVSIDEKVCQRAMCNAFQIGKHSNSGLGWQPSPLDVAKRAAEEDREALTDMLIDADIVIIFSGMGGRTGTFASSVIADIAKNELKALTVAIVSKPFGFEGKKRTQFAEQGIEELGKYTDVLIVIPYNILKDNLLARKQKGITIAEALNAANHILCYSAFDIISVIASQNLIDVDSDNVRSLMFNAGFTMCGAYWTESEEHAIRAIKYAIDSLFLEKDSFPCAKSFPMPTKNLSKVTG